ncbi:MAG: YidC/Oxa1 family membrane protein insertase [Acidobacteria bacterium]|nr:YidC/Oxa1 family membrane protein insertase [Acidobacteriota bacterium]
MFDLIAQILAFFYSLVPNYALSIALLTVAVMTVVLPLTLTSTKSMIKMQRLQPEMREIQQKYKDDRQRMNEELMAFYQANSINPVGGCLPMFIQLPIFLVLFQVIRGLTRRTTDTGIMFGQTSEQIAGQVELTGPPDVVQKFNPAYLHEDSTMYEDLANSNEMVSFGVDLSRSLTQVLSDGVVDALPYIAMILVVLGTSVVQQRQIQGRTRNTQTNSQQQMLMKIMPYMLPIFAIAMPAALLVYFIMSNVFRVVQQGYITRSMYGDNDGEIEVIRPDTSKAKSKASKAEVTTQARPKSSSKRSSGSGTKKKSTASSKSQSSSSSARSRRTTAGEGGSSGGHSGRTTAAGTSKPRSRKKKKRK